MTQEDGAGMHSRRPQLDLSWAERLVGHGGVDQLRVHFGDLYMACGDVVQKIDRVNALAQAAQSEDMRRTLAQLEAQLYDHFLPHLEQLRPTLSALTTGLYAEAEQDEGGV